MRRGWPLAGRRRRYVQAVTSPHPHAKRGRAIWWFRAGALAFVVAYLLLPYSLTVYVPIWLPFLCVLAVEVQFFVSGLRSSPGQRPASGIRGGPQEHDLVELSDWSELDLPQGGTLHLGEGELTAAEVAHWAALHAHELAALPPGDYEVGPLRLEDGPEALPRRVPAVTASTARRLPRWRHIATAAALVLLTAALLLVWRPGSWQRLSEPTRASAQALYSQIATSIAGHPAQVHCDTGGHHVGVTQDADGLAAVGGRQAWLTPAICYTLYQLKTRRIRPDSSAAGRAIAVLAHEAWHLRGEASEALANCYGYQSGVNVGVELGLSEAAARHLMREQLADNPIDYAGSPAYLVPSECHNNGAYDLHPRDPDFP
jgi:hypothetical protein